MKNEIQALAAARPYDVADALARIPYDALGEDYRANPEKACRKALKLTLSMANKPNRRLRAIDQLLGMHGVETIRTTNGEHAFSYANAGDTYDCTVILWASGKFQVSDWGTIVERRMNQYA